MEKETWAELKEAGQRHFQAKEYVEAAASFRKATDLLPASAEGWRALGFALNACGEHSEAITAFHSAVGLDPNNAEGFFGVGLAFTSNADYERAIKALDEALKLRPNHTAAKNCLVEALLGYGKVQLNASDNIGGGVSLERAYKLNRVSAATVLPYVQHLIVSQQHKKAFTVIRAARADASSDVQIRALETQMEDDPKLAHAKHLQSLQSQPKRALQPQRPTSNPDEIDCPCGSTKVMKWATVCPTCNQRIGDPSKRASTFAGYENLKGYNWIDVCYYIVSSLWLLWGLVILAIGLFSGGFFGGYIMWYGAFNAGVALGLLFQVPWLQFVGKIVMVLNCMFGSWNMMIGLGLSSLGSFIFGFFTVAIAGFSWWLINQLSD